MPAILSKLNGRSVSSSSLIGKNNHLKRILLPLLLKKNNTFLFNTIINNNKNAITNYHTNLQTFSAFNPKIQTTNSSNNNNQQQEKKKKISFLKFLFFIIGTVISFPIFLYFYLKQSEQVDSLKYNPKDFILKLNNNFYVYKHYFQMRKPPVAGSSNMAVIKYGGEDNNENVLIYNAIGLTDTLKELLASKEIGDDNLRVVILPNKEHYLFSHEFIKYYVLERGNTNIKFFCAPGSKDKIIKHVNQQLGKNLTDLLQKIMIEFPKSNHDNNNIDNNNKLNLLPKEWIEDENLNKRFKVQVFESIEDLSEIVLFDTLNKMLITCDMSNNIENAVGDATIPNTKGLIFYYQATGMLGKFGISPLYKYLVKDKNKFNEELNNVCEWDWKGVSMAHGKPLEPTESRDLKKEWKDEVVKHLLQDKK
ncbi:hypothetical protein ABK040_002468 [Willaertia magna]